MTEFLSVCSTRSTCRAGAAFIAVFTVAAHFRNRRFTSIAIHTAAARVAAFATSASFVMSRIALSTKETAAAVTTEITPAT
jgi:hypothetical protein